MRVKRLLGASVIRAPSQRVSKLTELRADVLGQPALNPDVRTVHTVMQKPLRGEMLMAHWNVPDVWDWPRATGVEWRDLKRESGQEKLQALFARGKGPLARKQQTEEPAKGGKKKK